MNTRAGTGLLGFSFLALTFAAGCGTESGQSQNENDFTPSGAGGSSGGAAGVGGAAGAAGSAGVGGANQGGSGGIVNPDGTNANDAGMPQAGDDGTWCEALAVFRDRCQSCHAEELSYGAPMPLVTYEDTQATSMQGNAVWEEIGNRIHDAESPMPPSNWDPLTDTQIAAVDAWIAAGAPSAEDPTCGGQPETKGDEEKEFSWPEDCDERYEFRANDGNGGPYTVPANAEVYPQFEFDTPWDPGEVQMVKSRPITDNKRVIHHWILYENGNFITGWAPGGDALETDRENVGTYVPSEGTFVLDSHYYNVGNDQPEQDSSGVEICITREPREYTAAVFPFTGNATAPANQTVENQTTCTVNTDREEGVHIISSSPHMHELGTHAKLEILDPNGDVRKVVHNDAFEFENQLSVPVDATVYDGDQVRITCEYKNTTMQDVAFGTSTSDEMCFNFALHYPMCSMTCAPADPFAAAIHQSQGAGCPSSGGDTGGSGFF